MNRSVTWSREKARMLHRGRVNGTEFEKGFLGKGNYRVFERAKEEEHEAGGKQKVP